MDSDALRHWICDVKIWQIPALTSSDVNLRLSTGKFILKAQRITVKIAVNQEINRTIVIFRWKMEIYFISWTLDGNIFTRGKPVVKICRLMFTRWNKFRSSTENNNYPINIILVVCNYKRKNYWNNCYRASYKISLYYSHEHYWIEFVSSSGDVTLRFR